MTGRSVTQRGVVHDAGIGHMGHGRVDSIYTGLQRRSN
jgi:hypothetical protein